MHEPEHIVVFAQQMQALAVCPSCFKFLSEKIMIDFFILKCQNTCNNAAFAIMSERQKVIVVVIQFNQIAFFWLPFNAFDGARKHPWVKAVERFNFPCFKNETGFGCDIHVF